MHNSNKKSKKQTNSYLLHDDICESNGFFPFGFRVPIICVAGIALQKNKSKQVLTFLKCQLQQLSL